MMPKSLKGPAWTRFAGRSPLAIALSWLARSFTIRGSKAEALPPMCGVISATAAVGRPTGSGGTVNR